MKIIVSSNRYTHMLPHIEDMLYWSHTTLNSCKQKTDVIINIAGLGAQQIQKLNYRYRAIDKPTNILSFAAGEVKHPQGLIFLGDIAICPSIVKQEISRYKKNASYYWCHLIVHSILHLLGYDHQKDNEALVMQNKEIEILFLLGIPNPYKNEDIK